MAAWFCVAGSSAGAFSLPCLRRGLPGGGADLKIVLSSLFVLLPPKYPSSIANVLPFAGDNGVPACERPPFVGLPKPAGDIFMAFSKATGRSVAPGGFRFLLGLPCGVETGVMKLLRIGVLGLSFWLERV